MRAGLSADQSSRFGVLEGSEKSHRAGEGVLVLPLLFLIYAFVLFRHEMTKR